MCFAFHWKADSQYSPAVESAQTTSFLGAVIRGLGTLLASIIYRVTTFGREKLPAGGFLLLPNHLTWVDAVVLQLACPRQIRFIVFEDIFKLWWLNPIFQAVGALPISGKRA